MQYEKAGLLFTAKALAKIFDKPDSVATVKSGSFPTVIPEVGVVIVCVSEFPSCYL